eukprot:TRINITY_DN81_c0_g2_i2.p1 TRINITY_DN81_c0_g2~~TRINITY_DN81_c0_g2_i2.p1  ORF type:complete len:300 (+),score=69.12 TRINITY_DN81_c0_g2_i2:194-1093(+)
MSHVYIESDWDRLYWFKIVNVRRYPYLPVDLFRNLSRFCDADGYTIRKAPGHGLVTGLMVGRKRGLKINIIPKFRFQVVQVGSEFEIIFSYFAKMKLGTGIAGAILTFGLTAAMAPISALACYTEAVPFMRAVWRQVDTMVGRPFVVVFENEVLHAHVKSCQGQQSSGSYPGGPKTVIVSTPPPSGYPPSQPAQAPVYGYPPQPTGAYFPVGTPLPPGYSYGAPPPGVQVPPGFIYAVPMAPPPGYYPPQPQQPAYPSPYQAPPPGYYPEQQQQQTYPPSQMPPGYPAQQPAYPPAKYP